MNETWLPVVGYEGFYDISDHGRVRTVARVAVRRNGSPMPVRERILKTYKTPPMGYLAVKVQNGGRETRKGLRVHVMVLEAFVGPRPDGLVGCHGPGGIYDNSPSNLRWDTQRENVIDTVRDGHHHLAKKAHCLRNHPFDEQNTYIKNDGGRQCRECQRASVRRSDRRRSAKRNALA
jgi:NUMOD4 motif-containing protein/HNH endonuclease